MAKTLDYDFTAPLFNGTTGIEAQTGPDLTVTRASDATVMDYFNVLKTVNDNEPRFTGGRRVENLCLQSNDFDTTWIGLNEAGVANATTDPDGTSTAYQLIDDSGTGTGQVRFQQNYTFSATPRQYTISLYAKSDQLTWFRLAMINITGQSQYAYFDLTNGVVGATLGADNDAQGIEDVGSGWYRCWVSFTSSASDTTGTFGINCADGNNDITVDLDGTSSIYIYGAQLEDVSGQDDPAPSAYIATTTAAKAQWYATKRRTSYTEYSEAVGSWSTLNEVTVSSEDVANPLDATTTADKIIPSTNSAAHLAVNNLYSPFTSPPLDTPVVASVYVKAAGYNGVTFNMGGSRIYMNVDLTDGSINSSGGSSVTTSRTFSVEDIGSGWYRLIMGWTWGLSQGNYLRVCPNETAGHTGTASETFAGDGTSGIYAYGAQLERGSTATAYIATTDSVASSSFDTAITPTGLLVEEARTNICTYSEDLGTSWSSLKADITETNSATAPDGTATADKLKDDSSGGSQAVTVYKGITTVTSTTYTFSTYAKADGVSWLYLYVAANASEVIHAYYDLTNGVVGATLGADNVDQGIEDVGNGWFRCWITYTAADNGQQPAIRLADSDGDSSVDCTTGASSTFLWGMSLEAGSFPTSYIPTTTASVTRNKDNVSTTDLTWYNAAEGSVYTHANTFDAVGDVGIFSLNDSTTHRYYLYAFNDDVRAVIVSPGTNGILLSTANEYASKAFVRSSLGLAANDMALYGNGTLVGTTASVDMPTPVTFAVGSFLGANFLNGHIARIVYYDERLDDATLEDLSNGTFPSAQFPGTVAGDGGHIWPPRANDPRWTQIISDSGITASGNFIDDVHAALEALGSTTGQLDDLWKKVKAANSVTDTSEPYLY